jgi:PAS domain S-box-containing protein
MTQRAPRRSAEGRASGPPDFVRHLLDEWCAPVPYQLYGMEAGGSLFPRFTSGLELDRRDPWTLELTTAGIWEACDRPGAVPAARLSRRPGLPAPASPLFLRPVREEGGLCGGLLLCPEGSQLPSGMSARLAEPRFDAVLRLILSYGKIRGERERLQEFRDSVAQTLPYGILALDALGRVVYLGGRAAEILGTSEEEALGSDCTRVFRPLAEGKNPLLTALKGPLAPVELYIAGADGAEVPVLLQVARWPRRAVRAKGLVAFFQDLTEERALEEAERHRDRLAVLGELSAGVAHEIRNPLTGIANCAQVLLEGAAPEAPSQRFLHIILDEVARLNRIVEGLLNYARPNRPELKESSPEECARRAMELIAPDMEQKGIRLQFRLAGRIPRIYLDGAQITQVLLNLLRNAMEAMPGGGEAAVEIAVIRRRSHRRRSPGRRAGDRRRLQAAEGPLQRYVQIKVIDTGHGIRKDLQSRVFNPFFTTRTRGTGLGLSLSQSIMREHGGLLTIRSVENKGTTVLLDLPVERRQGERRKESG